MLHHRWSWVISSCHPGPSTKHDWINKWIKTMTHIYKEKEKRLWTEKSICSSLPGCSIIVLLAMLLHHCFAGCGSYPHLSSWSFYKTWWNKKVRMETMNQKHKEKEKRLWTEKSICSPLPGCFSIVSLAMLLHHCVAGCGSYPHLSSWSFYKTGWNK